MWIVELALRRPYSSVVLALLIVIFGLLSLTGTSMAPGIAADVLPEIRIPIVAVTSYALSGDEEKTRAAGCDSYIAKPYSPRQMLAKVREILGS